MTDADASGSTPGDPRCFACGQDLWSVPFARYCPACGASIGARALRIADDRALRIAAAIFVVEVGVSLVAFFGVANATLELFIVMRQQGGRVNFITFGVPTDFGSVIGWFRLIAASVWAAGWWLVAGAARDHAPMAAKVIRACIAGLVIVIVVTGSRRAVVSTHGLTPLDLTCIVLNIACYAAVFVSAMRLSHRVAIDAGHPRLARHAVTLTWLIPLLATAGAFLIVGPLIAAGLWIAFLELLRRHIAGAPSAPG